MCSEIIFKKQQEKERFVFRFKTGLAHERQTACVSRASPGAAAGVLQGLSGQAHREPRQPRAASSGQKP